LGFNRYSIVKVQFIQLHHPTKGTKVIFQNELSFSSFFWRQVDKRLKGVQEAGYRRNSARHLRNQISRFGHNDGRYDGNYHFPHCGERGQGLIDDKPTSS
jgi:hypothetical protein